MNRYKSQFLANTSRELRTPLHAIIGFSELLHDEIHAANLDPKQRVYAGPIWESGRHLRLVELHGGSMHVTSALGRGSTFAVDLPKHVNLD